MVSRRNFLKIGAGAAALGAAATLAFDDSSDDIELLISEIPVQRLPTSFNGYRIGFLSDIHLSHALPVEWLERAVSLLAESKIDILILGGDYVWLPEPGKEPLIHKLRNKELDLPYGKELMKLAFETVVKSVSILKPKDGSFAVWGNHDRWTSEKVCVQAFAKSHIKLIANGTKIIRRGNDKILLALFDDFWTGHPEIPKNIRSEACIIAAAHNPDFFSYLLKSKEFRFDLGIAGHTHGGQIKAPLFGAPFQNIRDIRLSEGLFRDQSGSAVYTSRGLGMVEIPYRINCRPEVSVLEVENSLRKNLMIPAVKPNYFLESKINLENYDLFCLAHLLLRQI